MAQVIQNVSAAAFMVAGFRVETERVQRCSRMKRFAAYVLLTPT